MRLAPIGTLSALAAVVATYGTQSCSNWAGLIITDTHRDSHVTDISAAEARELLEVACRWNHQRPTGRVPPHRR